jgi:hypothetical protein
VIALLPLFAITFAAVGGVTSFRRRTDRRAAVPRWVLALVGIAPLIVLMALRWR